MDERIFNKSFWIEAAGAAVFIGSALAIFILS